MARPIAKWKIIAASVPGRSHLARRVECQDACQHQILPDGTLIAAVADGAGSARLAAEGSAMTVRAAIEYLAGRLLAARPDTVDACRDLLRGCLTHARHVLVQRAELGGAGGPEDVELEAIPLSDFSTTMLAAFATDAFFACIQVGDGAIVYRDRSGILQVATEPDQGEYLNETTFITSDDADRRARYCIAASANLEAVAMLSDGLQMLGLTYQSNNAHAPFFNPLFDFARESDASDDDLERFLISDPVCERSDDDKTLVLWVRANG